MRIHIRNTLHTCGYTLGILYTHAADLWHRCGGRRVTRGLPVVDAPLFFSFLFVQGATVEAPKGPTKSAHHWRSPCALSVRSGCARHVWLLTGRQACVVAGRQREGGRKREASIRNGRREREERRRKRRGNGAREGGRKGRLRSPLLRSEVSMAMMRHWSSSLARNLKWSPPAARSLAVGLTALASGAACT